MYVYIYIYDTYDSETYSITPEYQWNLYAGKFPYYRIQNENIIKQYF